jgi:hypothetical protein
MTASLSETEMARYWAEISRLREQLQRFTEAKMRMYEGKSSDGPLQDVTDVYVERLRDQIAEQERFLALVKGAKGGVVS